MTISYIISCNTCICSCTASLLRIAFARFDASRTRATLRLARTPVDAIARFNTFYSECAGSLPITFITAPSVERCLSRSLSESEAGNDDLSGGMTNGRAAVCQGSRVGP